MKKQLAAVLAAFLLAFLPTPVKVMAAPKIVEEFFPSGEITAPQAPFLQYDGKKDDGDSITMWYVVPKDVLALAGAYNRWGDANDGRESVQSLPDDSDFRQVNGARAGAKSDIGIDAIQGRDVEFGTGALHDGA